MELFNKTAHSLRDMLRNGEITSEELVKAHFDRIDKVDDKVNAYITLDKENAIKKAKEIDSKIAKGEELPDLAGIPMAIKDNICTRGVKTTCASKMLSDFVPPYNATVVDLLESQGAIMLGKLNLDEFAMGGSTENSYFNPSRNPWDLDRTPGGSSGGSSAAVAAGEAVYSIGTDTGGSIRQPASHCLLVGLKPTNGLVSRYGAVAFSSSFDQVSPITKDVEDMALVLNAIAKQDSKDTTSVKTQELDYTTFLGQDIKGLKVGIPKEYMADGIDSQIRDYVLDTAKKLEELGAIISNVSLPSVKYSLPAYYIIACSEASSNLARFDGVAFGHRTKSYTDVDTLYSNSRGEGFGKEVKRRIVLGTFALSSENYNDYYKKAMEAADIIRKEHKEIFKEVDILLSPNMSTTAPKLGEVSDNPVDEYLKDICTINANIAGIPAMSVPVGFDNNGLPIGVQIMAGEFKEDTILKVAYQIEKSSNVKSERPKL